MPSSVNRSTRRDALILLAAVLLVLLYVAAAGGNFPLDDSWIHQTYGRNLALNGEWAFLPGVPSAASTSPLYTVVLSVGYALGVPFRLWAHGLGALALALTGMIGARMAAQVLPNSRYTPLATGLALVFAWHLLWAAASGMETMIFSLFTLLLIWLGWQELGRGLQPRSQSPRSLILRGALFGAAAALATLTRPEGVLLAGLVGLALLITRPHMTWRSLILWSGAALVAFLLVLAPYLVYNLRVTGGLLPNTAAAKRAESAPYLARDIFWRIGNVTTPLIAGGQVLLIPGMIAYLVLILRGVSTPAAPKSPAAWIKTAPLLVLPLVWSAALILLYAVTLPLEFQHGRYVIPALPSAIVGGVIGMAWLLNRTRHALLGRVVVRVVALSGALLFAACAFVLGLQAYVLDVRVINQEMVGTAAWIRANLSPDDLLVTHDIGAVGYFAPRPLLDIAGLVSPEVIPLMTDPEAIWSLMRDRDAKYLMALWNQIPGGDLNDPRLCQVFTTGGDAAGRAGGSNMTIYALNWNATGCE